MHKEKDLESIFNKLYFQFWQFWKCLCDRNSQYYKLIYKSDPKWLSQSKDHILHFAKVHISDDKIYKFIFEYYNVNIFEILFF